MPQDSTSRFLVLLLGLAVGLAGLAVYVLELAERQPASRTTAPLPGMDAGMRAQALRLLGRPLQESWGQSGPWIRLRGHPMTADRPDLIGREVVALREFTTLGFKPIILLRWSEDTWQNGIRPGGGQRLPHDLREAFQRAYAEGRNFGGTGASFEFENEPDISFVQDNPETYLAFLKACYLGVKQGAAAAANIQYPTLNIQRPSDEPGEAPRVVMAPLALPPGPYFEQMVANGLFSYTDAFNYHYYGYAEDFAGVYGQFAAAVRELQKPETGDLKPELSGAQLSGLPSVKKTLPVLLTEYGYGALGNEARDTVEGRVRQWRWFKSVGEDITRLRIAGPMAFYLPPYLENKQLEFGLSMRAAVARAELPTSNFQLPTSNVRNTVNSNTKHFSGGLVFTPQDFQLDKSAPWMTRIGQRFGGNAATPALAWLLDEGARRPYAPKDWTVEAPEPSPIVIDFIAGDGLAQAKRYGGYVAQRYTPKPAPPPIAKPAPPPEKTKPPEGPREPQPPPVPGLPKGFIPSPAWFGTGAVVLYNFSDQSIRGRLRIERGSELLFDTSTLAREWTLDPMSRTVVEINLRIPALTFTRNEFALSFTHEKMGPGGQRPETGDLKPEFSESPTSSFRSQVSGLVTVFSTAFYPNYPLMRETVVHDFTARDVGLHLGARLAGNAEGTDQGPALQGINGDPALQLAPEEPRLAPAGRWRVTKGVAVEETADRTWRFTIAGYPDEPEKSAMAELPLPEDFTFPDRSLMRFFYRLAAPAGADLKTGKYMEAYFRTSNGNLYQVWPRQYATEAWSEYNEAKENYTMAFYGRANLPWRFRDNRPVSLVFFFRPGRESLPAVYEISHARIVRLMH